MREIMPVTNKEIIYHSKFFENILRLDKELPYLV